MRTVPFRGATSQRRSQHRELHGPKSRGASHRSEFSLCIFRTRNRKSLKACRKSLRPFEPPRTANVSAQVSVESRTGVDRTGIRSVSDSGGNWSFRHEIKRFCARCHPG